MANETWAFQLGYCEQKQVCVRELIYEFSEVCIRKILKKQ